MRVRVERPRVVRPGPRYAVAAALVGALALAAVPGGPALAGAATTGNSTSSDDAASSSAAPTPGDVRPRVDALARPLRSVADGEPVDPAALEERVADEMADRWLGPGNRRAFTVRDALTGEHLYDRQADRAVTPASTAKILSAAAIVEGLDPSTRFTTRVVQGATPQEVVLVAGGDMLLADGPGDTEAVAGHAGIGDLAAQTADALAEAGVEGPVTVQLDLSYVEGPTVLDTWTDLWVDEGWTGRVTQLGRSVDRATPYNPAPEVPAQEAARVLRAALAAEGVRVRGGKDATAEVVGADDAAAELAAVESAPLRDVLALGLATSDNAMLEQLARQAAHAAGAGTGRTDVAEWIRATIADGYGIDTTDVRLADASGLSDGTRIPVRVVADVLVAGADGSHPGLQEVLAGRGLPIAGYTGTLATRFHLPVHAPAIGTARAKTGTLPGISSLAGTVVTEDGRLLVFATTADRIDDGAAMIEARSVQDEVVAELALCGC